MKWYLMMVVVIAIATGCKWHDGVGRQAITEKPWEVILRFGDTPQHDLSLYGDEDKARILHLTSFNVLEGFCSDNREPLVYCYTARSWFDGLGTVSFEVSSGSDGSNRNTVHERPELIIKLTPKIIAYG